MTHLTVEQAPATIASPRRRMWLYVVAGTVAICMMTGITLFIGGIVMFKRHVHSEATAPELAMREFDSTAARFASTPPLIELRDGRTVAIHRTPDRPRQHVEALHLLIYDADDGRLVRITVPGWLLRFVPASDRSSAIRIDGVEGFDSSSEHPVTFEDFERHGPGLIIDGRGRRRGERLLAWIE